MRHLVRLTIISVLLCSLAGAGTITIGSFDGSVSLRPFTGSSYSNLLAVLANPANFGPGGINSSSVSIAPAVSSVDAGVLSGYNVFVMSEVSGISASQASALANWVTGGGLLVIAADSGGNGAAGGNAVLSLLDGSFIGSSGDGDSGSTVGSIGLAGRSSVGLFGNLVGSAFAASPGSPLTPGGNSSIVGTNAQVNFIMETNAGSGAVLTTADVLFMNFFVPPASVFSGPNNPLLFENFISSNDVPVTVPEPSSFFFAAAGLLALRFGMRRRSS